MTDAPYAAEPPPVPGADRRTGPNRLWVTVTIFCGLVTGGCAVLLASLTWFVDPVDYLEDPVRAVAQVGEVDLDFVTVVDEQSVVERQLLAVLGYSTERARDDVISGYVRILQHVEGEGSGFYPPSDIAALRGRLAVALAESDRLQEAVEVLEALPETAEADAFSRAFRAAYDPDDLPAPANIDLSLLELEGRDAPVWSSDIVQHRLGERADATAAAEAMHRIRARGRQLIPWARGLAVAEILVLGGGWLLIALRWRAAIREFWTAGGITVAPWSFPYGSAVLMRCVTVLVAAQVVVWMLPDPFLLQSTLLTGVAALVLAHGYLFKPYRMSLVQAFGLGPPDIAWTKVACYALGLTAVDQLGCLTIHVVLDAFGLDHLWEEAVDETILFGPRWQALLLSVDGVVWAPLFEEIGFRGLLYVTLRTRMRPLPAATAAALVFGLAHLYSLAGFLEVTWTGFILAVGYERCRSLWPCIVAHGYNNLFYFVAMWAFYR